MRMTDLLLKKRNGGELNEQEIAFLVRGITDDTIPDYQLSAFCMAVVFRGMTPAETAALTAAMAASGDRLDLSAFGDRTVDKHSTGGVGDKTTLVVAPLVAACGGIIAKMSGRGLGHTGGTIDKLESIRGYRTELSTEEFYRQVERIGIAVIGQSAHLVPADKRLYALRDVTATVDSLPLIASSIMSKKLAAGSHSILLDCKTGSGAMLHEIEQTRELARQMVQIGRANGRSVAALITDMSVPLGQMIGNALEVREALSVLAGGGPADLREVCIGLAGAMLSLSRHCTRAEGEAEAASALSDGRAYRKCIEWMTAQGGDERVLLNPDLLPAAAQQREVYAKTEGYISSMDTAQIGNTAVLLGAGRTEKGAPISYGAGIRVLRKTGEYVSRGDLLAVLYADTPDVLPMAEERYLSALSYAQTPPQLVPHILDYIC